MTHVKFSILVSAVTFGITALTHGQSETFLTNGLAAFYLFDGNANDASGNGNTGVSTGVTLTTDRFGRADSSYQFTGFNFPPSFIRITNSTALQFPADFAVSAWINFSGGTQGPRVVSTSGYELVAEGTGSQRSLTANNTTANGVFGLTTTNLFPANKWLHVVYRRAGNEIAIYVNGRLEAAQTSLGTNDYSNGYTPKIGGNSGIDFDAFGGKIDDVRFYNRALSAQEIAGLFAVESGSPLSIEVAAVRVGWFAESNFIYQVQRSTDFKNWSNVTSIVGGGTLTNVIDWTDGTRRYYRTFRE